jgi:hypothetical protein
MRKKSHVSLAKYLLDNVDSELLMQHRKAFILGSIVPDCKPSFVTTKHNMEETFSMVCDFISSLTVNAGEFKKISTAYCRRLGEVTHYLADYFTFPHNAIFNGTLREHCSYEKKLKFALREYIEGGVGKINSDIVKKFTTPSQLCDFVKKIHEQYLACKKTVESDCHYIVALCHVAVAGILHLLELNPQACGSVSVLRY